MRMSLESDRPVRSRSCSTFVIAFLCALACLLSSALVQTAHARPLPDMLAPTAAPDRMTLLRLYNPNSGEHFYTCSAHERDELVRLGWNYEGKGWDSPLRSTEPVYRLYNAYEGDHHYTTWAEERDVLVEVGWIYEGVGWYSDTARGVPVYREYNTHARTGAHNFTASLQEHVALIKLGWSGEGIAWYGMSEHATHVVTLDDQGGHGGAGRVRVTEGQVPAAVAVPVRPGYTFEGYFAEPEGRGTRYVGKTGTWEREWADTHDRTVYACWSANTYTVSYDAAGGEPQADSHDIVFGMLPDLEIAKPERHGYVFGGYWQGAGGTGTCYVSDSGAWSHAYDIAGSATLHAKWTALTTAVTLDDNGGAGGSGTVVATYGQKPTSVAVPALHGYVFEGYFTAVEGGTMVVGGDGAWSGVWERTDESLTLFARWAPHVTTVALNDGAGSGGSGSVVATFGQKPAAVTVPARTGYDFGGYYTEAGGAGTCYVAADGSWSGAWDSTDDAMELFAAWTARQTAVTLNDGEGSGGSGTVTATFDATPSNVAVPAYPGHSFGGYYSEPEGAGTRYVDETGVWTRAWDIEAPTTTLYALWSVKVYTITLDDGLGSGGAGTTTSQLGQLPETAVTPPTYQGYDFNGYFAAEGDASSTRYIDSSGAWVSAWDQDSPNAIIYALWTPSTVTVTLDAQGGTPATTAVSVTTGTKPDDIEVPARTGHVFLGYYAEPQSAGATDDAGDEPQAPRQLVDADGAWLQDWAPEDCGVLTTLYAHWQAKSYTLTLDDGEGSGGVGTMEVTYGVQPAEPVAVPTHATLTFAGYFADASDTSSKQYVNVSGAWESAWDQDVDDPTIYAIWGEKVDTWTHVGQALYDDAIALTDDGEIVDLGAKPSYTGGSWQVGTPEQLAYVAYCTTNRLLPAGTTASITLTGDIDLTGATYGGTEAAPLAWTPIANFGGTLAGASHTISHMGVSVANNAALIGSLSAAASVSDLTVASSSVAATTARAAAVLGQPGNYDFSASDVTVTDTAVSSAADAGGVVAYVAAGTTSLERCAVLGSTVTGGSAGGLVGRTMLSPTPVMTITGSRVEGATVTGATHAGGLVGSNRIKCWIRISSVTDTEVVNTNTTTSWTGGLVGHTSGAGSTTVEDCYSRATLSCAGTSAGLVANENQTVTLTDSYFAGTMATENTGNCALGYLGSVTTQNCFFDKSLLAAPADAAQTGVSGLDTDHMTTAALAFALNNNALGEPWNWYNDANDRYPVFGALDGQVSTITLNHNGGTSSTSSVSVLANSMPVGTVEIPTRDGYSFGGYELDGVTYTNAAGVWEQAWDNRASATLTAIWTANTYTVTLDDTPGSGGSGSQSVTFDSTPEGTLSVPTRTGYTFDGYFSETGGAGTKYVDASGAWTRAWDIADNTTLYAGWTPKTYTVTLVDDPGSGGQGTASVTFDATSSTAVTKPTRTGHSFLGYYATANDPSSKQYVNSDGAWVAAWDMDVPTPSIYACWEEGDYTVTYNDNGGSGGSGSKSVTFSSTPANAAVPVRAGYDFAGYYETADDTSSTQYVRADGTWIAAWTLGHNATVYACWTPHIYTITLDDNGGSGGSGTTTATYLETPTTTVTVPTHANKAFAGYYADATNLSSTKYIDASGAWVAAWDQTAETPVIHAVWGEATDSWDAVGAAYVNGDIVVDASGNAVDLGAAPSYTDGSWQITRAEDLAYVAYCITHNALPAGTNANMTLTADVDLTGSVYGGTADTPIPWTPITGFTGTFNGNDKSISHCAVSETGPAALIGTLAGPTTINDLSLSNATLTSSAGIAAGVVADAQQQNLEMRDVCLSEAAVSGAGTVGGLVGAGTGSLALERCSVASTTITNSANEIWTAGLVGRTASEAEKTVTIEDCFARATITAQTKSAGLVGCAGATTTITDAYFSGAMTPKLDECCGIAYRTNVTTSRCYVDNTLLAYPADQLEKGVKAAPGNNMATAALAFSLNHDTVGQPWTQDASKNDGFPVFGTLSSDVVYMITFEDAPGSGGSGSLDILPGLVPMTDVEVPTYSGYTFVGYYTGEGGTGRRYVNQDGSWIRAWDFDSEETLYAAWEPNRYTATLDDNGGSGGIGRVPGIAFGETPTQKVDVPTKPGQAFCGYFATANDLHSHRYIHSGGVWISPWDRGENATIYANWVDGNRVIVLDDTEGSGGDAFVGVEAGVLPTQKVTVPVRDGYAFLGYFATTDSSSTKYIDGSGTWVAPWISADNGTIHACWSKIEDWGDVGEALYHGVTSVVMGDTTVELGSVPTYADGAWQVDRPEALAYVGYATSGSILPSGTTPSIKLTNDIDLTGFAYGGTTENPFPWVEIWDYTGTFDGNSKTISHMAVSNSARDIGLIGRVNDTMTIRNLTMTDSKAVVPEASDTSAGIVVGLSNATTTLENVHVADSQITSPTTNKNAGLGCILGYFNNTTTATGCSAERCSIKATAGWGRVGGLFGLATFGSNKTLRISDSWATDNEVTGFNIGGIIGAFDGQGGCHYYLDRNFVHGGSITLAAGIDNDGHAGGIVGSVWFNANTADFNNCAVIGTTITSLASRSPNVGGIIGRRAFSGTWTYRSRVNSCYFAGVLVPYGTASVWPISAPQNLVGSNEVNNCVYDADIVGGNVTDNFSGVRALSTEQMKSAMAPTYLNAYKSKPWTVDASVYEGYPSFGTLDHAAAPTFDVWQDVAQIFDGDFATIEDPTGATFEATKPVYSDGSWQVQTPEQFAYVAYLINTSALPSGTTASMTITADLDMTGERWRSNTTKPLRWYSIISLPTSTLDGGGHTVSNLDATSRDLVFGGLIGSLTNATVCTIKDLTIDGITAIGKNRASVIVSDAWANSGLTISNVCVRNADIRITVSGDAGYSPAVLIGLMNTKSSATTTVRGCVMENCTLTGGSNAGAVSGYTSESTGPMNISDCMVRNISISSTGNTSGGYCGYLRNNTTLTRCGVEGCSIQTNHGDGWAGGLVGAMAQGGRTLTVTDCYVTGASITSPKSPCGLVKFGGSTVRMKNCYFAGTLSRAGYAIAYAYGSGTLEESNCYYDISLLPAPLEGSTTSVRGLSTAAMKTQNVALALNESEPGEPWTLDESANDGYPSFGSLEVETQTVTFDDGAGTGGSGSRKVIAGTTPAQAVNVPTLAESDFLGYYVDRNDENTKYIDETGTWVRSYDLGDGATLHAKWSTVTYDVLLDDQGGVGGSGTVEAAMGQTPAAVAVPTLTGHDFNGYFTEADGGGTQYVDETGAWVRAWDKDEPTTLYAYWTLSSYTVTLNDGEGSGGSGSVSVLYTQKPENNVAVPQSSDASKSFVGYFAEVGNLDSTKYVDSTGTWLRTWDNASDGTIYAVYERGSNIVTLDDTTGSGGDGFLKVFSGEVPADVTVPTREGYEFSGYYAVDNNFRSTRYTDAQGKWLQGAWSGSENISIHACWGRTATTWEEVGRILTEGDMPVTADGHNPTCQEGLPRYLLTTWRVCSPEQLAYVAYAATNGKLPSGTSGGITLCADMDLTGALYGGTAESPIPWSTMHNLTGLFDGQGHTVSNVDVTTSGKDCGFIWQPSSGATVRNVIFDSCKAQASTNWTGIVMGAAGVYNVSFANVHVRNSSIDATASTGGAGGILGYSGNKNNTVSYLNCSVEDTTIAGRVTGGIHGYTAANTVTLNATDCWVDRCELNATIIAGGVAAHTIGNATMTRCFSRNSSIKAATDQWVGGLVGALNDDRTLTLVDCFSTASVTGYDRAAGLACATKHYVNATNCYFAGTLACTHGNRMAAISPAEATRTQTSVNCFYDRDVIGIDEELVGDRTRTGVSGRPTARLKSEPAAFALNGNAFGYPWTQSADVNGGYPFYGELSGTSVTVTLNDGEGTGGTESFAVIPGTMPVGDATVPVRSEYAFAGYYTEPNGAGTCYIDGTGTWIRSWDSDEGGALYAAWTWAPTSYTVTLNHNGGDGDPETVDVTYGVKPADLTSLPLRDGYVFTGYFESATDARSRQYVTADGTWIDAWDQAANKTLYAQWSPGDYAITLDDNGGTGGTGYTAIYAFRPLAGNVADVSVPQRPGYAFTGYYASPTDTASTMYVNQIGQFVYDSDIRSNITIYAQWTNAFFTATLDDGEGSGGSGSVDVTYGLQPTSPVTAPTPATPGAVFLGYFDQAGNPFSTRYIDQTGAWVRAWDKAESATLYACYLTNITSWADVGTLNYAGVQNITIDGHAVSTGTPPVYESGAWQVWSPEQLAAVATMTSNSVLPSGTTPDISLLADIDLTGAGFGGTTDAPLRWEYINNFYGSLLGNGHTISHLSSGASGADYGGLIGNVAQPVSVRNLTIDQAKIIGKHRIGVLIASVTAGVNLYDVHVSNSTINASGEFVGSLVGFITGSNTTNVIEHCSVTGGSVSTTIGSYGNAGGLVGGLYEGAPNLTMNDCFCTARVSSYRVGGLLGQTYVASGVTGKATISRCYFAGTLSASTSDVFAIAHTSVGTMEACAYDATKVTNAQDGSKIGVTGLPTDVLASEAGASTANGFEDSPWTYQAGVNDGYPVWGALDTVVAPAFENWEQVGALLSTTQAQVTRVDGSTFAVERPAYTDGSWRVSTPEQLAYVAYLITESKLPIRTSANITLDADIDLAGASWSGDNTASLRWVPIVNFSGTFNGAGHTISNMRIYENGDVGFFRGPYGQSRFENVTFTGCDVTVPDTGSTIRRAGVLLGSTNGNVVDIVDVHVLQSSVTLPTKSDNSAVGGIIGDIERQCVIQRSTVDTCQIAANYARAGGIAGRSRGGFAITFEDSSVINTSVGAFRVGGFLGTQDDTNNLTTIQRCMVRGGRVYGQYNQADTFTGGIVSSAWGAGRIVITDCAVQGTVIEAAALQPNAAGFSGRARSTDVASNVRNTTITNSYFAGTVVPGTASGTVWAIAKPLILLNESNCYYDAVLMPAAADDPAQAAGRTTTQMQSSELVDLLNAGRFDAPWVFVEGSYPELRSPEP